MSPETATRVTLRIVVAPPTPELRAGTFLAVLTHTVTAQATSIPARLGGIFTTPHPSHSWSASHRVRAPSSSKVITHEPSACGLSWMLPPHLVTTRFVYPGVPPCVEQCAGMARRLLPFNGAPGAPAGAGRGQTGQVSCT